MKKKKTNNQKFYYIVLIISIIFTLFDVSPITYLLFTTIYLLTKVLDKLDVLYTKEHEKDFSVMYNDFVDENQTTIYDFIGVKNEDK